MKHFNVVGFKIQITGSLQFNFEIEAYDLIDNNRSRCFVGVEANSGSGLISYCHYSRNPVSDCYVKLQMTGGARGGPTGQLRHCENLSLSELPRVV